MELVFEIGCEDLPARFVNPCMAQLRSNFVKGCLDRNILVDPQNVYVGGTPRRLVLVVEGLAEKQADKDEVRTGPPASAAFKDGVPTKAAEGFARGQGKGVEDLYTVATERGEYVAVRVFTPGQRTAEVLPAVLEQVMNGFAFPKSMRWGANRESFGRPVRWMVALLDGEVLPVQYAGVRSGNVTLGHRFAPAPGHDTAPSALRVANSAEYFAALKGNGIIVDFADRHAKVAALVAETATAAGGTAVDDAGLVDEVTNLVESPRAVLVRYDEAYLDLPDEVLISSMRGHQRYFAIQGADGKLTNACAVIYNTPVHDDAVVAAGNLRVLKARLDDAKFFWTQDQRKPLSGYVDTLDSVLWLNRLGSMRSKSRRIAALAERIAKAVGLGEGVAFAAKRAGELCKADLVTSMVYEFPDLQGTMGREYALRSDEPVEVARAIGEQYLPRGVDDALPQTEAGAVLAIAEKLDSLVGCFLIDLVPSSTADPYGLRRAALGTIRIMQGRGWTTSLWTLVDEAAAVYAESIDEPWTAERRAKLLEFFEGRLENQLAADHATDIVRAVLAVGFDDVTTVADRVAALSALRAEPVFEPLAVGFKRVVNILRKQAGEFAGEGLQVDAALFEHNEENQLWAATRAAKATMQESIDARDWAAAVGVLAGLREPVDAFFDHVMVMSEDPKLKRNRLALLFELESLFKRVADLSVVS